MKREDTTIGGREAGRVYTAGRGGGRHTRGAAPVGPMRQDTRARRFMRRVMQRVAILVALLVLFYATSLHGVSSRTFILAGALVLFLYWVFKGWL